MPGSKSWVEIRAGASLSPMSSMAGPFGTGSDPADMLASLRPISTSVTRLGTATIRGVRVTKFRVAIDPAKAAARLPRWQRAGFRAFARSLGSGTVPVTVWVGGQDLVRRGPGAPPPPRKGGPPPRGAGGDPPLSPLPGAGAGGGAPPPPRARRGPLSTT